MDRAELGLYSAVKFGCGVPLTKSMKVLKTKSMSFYC